jgi:hypothetical protein
MDEEKRNRTEIVCLIGFGKFECSGILKTNPLTSTRKSSTKEHISNTISNKNISDKPVANLPFSFSGYIESVLRSSKESKNWARYFAAYFLKRKGITFNSAASVEATMRRHYRAAKELGQFTGDMDRVARAFTSAENLVVNGQHVNWGLETVVKQLTK